MTSGDYVIRRDVRVPMRDGTELAADIWLPAAFGSFPTLLQRTPYGRGDSFGSQYIHGMETLRALDGGFAVVVQDTRGRFDSEGEFEPYVHEAGDGADTIAWIRGQDFSNGRVATYGASYVGATQMLLAMSGAEGHVAMAPFLTTGDYHHPWTYCGGALQLGFLWLWITESLGESDADHRGLSADSPVRDTLARLAADPLVAMSRLPLLDEELLTAAPYLRTWLTRPTLDDYWSSIRPIAAPERITARGLHIVGLNDIFAEGSLLAYRTLREQAGSADAREGQYLILGPWAHGNIGDWQGDKWLGYAAAAAALDLAGIQLEFFRAAMEGRRPEMARVRYFVAGANTWCEAEEWPPPGVEQALYLDTGGRLTPVAPPTGGADGFHADPANPVPTAGGQTFLPGVTLGKNSGLKDQSEVEARADILVYRSEQLSAPLRVAGQVRLELWAASSATDCDWTARLVDVDTTGSAVGVVDGILRARYRHGSEPTPLTPGRAELFTVELGNVSHEFAPGHRIGLQIASSNFPRFDRNPQQLLDPAAATAADFRPADQTVHHGAGRPSRLLFHVIN